ncbi:MAG: endonuclease/exonuclease/phosphatase family protein, partial [Verrucomicrobiota bacterium]|nr:endonuclease/exonuclease/phosphatase family protein [Verrucomicrobiota bacterium]
MVAAPRSILRVATYNVHGCVGTDGQRSEKRIAEVIASLSADVVGLQELDANRPRSGGVDQAALIAQALGWQHLFAPALRHGDELYGNAILSRAPIVLKQVIDLPGTGSWYCRETRVAIWAELETALGRVDIINTHFGLGRAERFLQAQLLAGTVPADRPLVLLGDFNSPARRRTHRFLAQSLTDVSAALGQPHAHRTYPTRFPLVAVDHIFVNAALQPLRI